jgi:hypothetical protein
MVLPDLELNATQLLEIASHNRRYPITVSLHILESHMADGQELSASITEARLRSRCEGRWIPALACLAMGWVFPDYGCSGSRQF